MVLGCATDQPLIRLKLHRSAPRGNVKSAQNVLIWVALVKSTGRLVLLLGCAHVGRIQMH